MVIVAELLLGRESDVPVPLQGASDQSIGWIDALVAPARQRGLIRGPFQPLFPLPTQLLTFEFEIFGDLKAHLDGGGRERLEHRGADERIDAMGADRLAARRPEGDSHLVADIARLAPVLVVGREHAPPAHATGHEAAPQRRAAARSAAVARAVCGHLRLVLLEGVPIYVSRQSPAMQHRPALRIALEASPTVRLAWQPETTIVVAPAVDISSRVGGVTKHVAERGPVGSVPADLSLVRPGADTVGELDVVIEEVAQQSAHRAAPLEDGEHQPDDLPDPLVRIEGNLAGRLEPAAARRPPHQFAALGFPPTPLMHPTLEDVQFGLAHRSLEAKQQAVVVGPRVVDAVGVPD